jgi:hypothetical protein
MPHEVAAALLASAEGYTPRATQLLDAARERLGSIQEVAGWIADNLPQPKTGPTRTRRRRRRKKKGAPETAVETVEGAETAEAAEGEAPAETPGGEDGEAAEAAPAPKKRRRRRRKPAEAGTADGEAPTEVEPAQPAELEHPAEDAA